VYIHLARLGAAPLQDTPVETIRSLAALDRFGKHYLTEDPDTADVILFSQCHLLPTDWRLTAIRDHELTSASPERVMVYDERDGPWCGFPGVYVSMPAGSFDDRYQRPWGYFPGAPVEPPAAPDLLFSFIGSPSDRCRKPLFDLRHADAVVEEVHQFTFFDPSSLDFDQRRQRFREVLNRSRFVLCPRGKGTSSIRLYETLAAGRVPVIIADDWVPPRGPAWEAFSLRWPEGKTDGLVDMLEERDRDWRAMSAAATACYGEFFAREVWFHRMAELCDELRRSGSLQRFPRSGLRNRAYLAVGANVIRWRTESTMRRAAKRVLR
jgi:hypothetical protein